jgi:AraC-like DNA-binding protein
MADISPARPSRFHFDTQTLPGNDRLAVWREVFGRQVARLDLRPVDSAETYRAEIAALPLPGLSISFCDYEGVQSARTPELTADGRDDVMIGFVESGSIHVAQAGRELSLTPGRATMLSTSLPSVAAAPGKLRLFNLVIPRPIIAARAPRVENGFAREVVGDALALTLLRHYTRTLFDSSDEQLTPLFLHTAVSHVHDLVALALGATRDSAEEARGRGLRAARLQAIKADMAKRLSNPCLTADGIARKHGVSCSYVRRLFEFEGTTFSEHLLNTRLAAAYRRLTDPNLRDRTILSIAMDAGFSDQSWFNRSFRRHFGAKPSDVRTMSAAAGREPPVSARSA